MKNEKKKDVLYIEHTYIYPTHINEIYIDGEKRFIYYSMYGRATEQLSKAD